MVRVTHGQARKWPAQSMASTSQGQSSPGHVQAKPCPTQTKSQASTLLVRPCQAMAIREHATASPAQPMVIGDQPRQWLTQTSPWADHSSPLPVYPKTWPAKTRSWAAQLKGSLVLPCPSRSWPSLPWQAQILASPPMARPAYGYPSPWPNETMTRQATGQVSTGPAQPM